MAEATYPNIGVPQHQTASLAEQSNPHPQCREQVSGSFFTTLPLDQQPVGEYGVLGSGLEVA